MKNLHLLVAALAVAPAIGCDESAEEAPIIDAGPDAEADVAVDLALDAAPAVDAAPVGCVEAPPRYVAHAVGEWTVHVDAATGAWQIGRPVSGQIVMRAPETCVDGMPSPDLLSLGVGEPGVDNAFGSFRIYLDGPTSDIEWTRIVTPPHTVEVGDDRVELVGDSARLRFSADEDGLRVELVSDADAGALSWRCGADTGFFGLGTQVVGLDLRGRRYPLFTQEQGIGKPENGQPFPLANVPEAAYAPMGVWHASDDWSALITHDAYSELDLCAAEPDRATLRSYGAMPGFVLLAGETLRDRLDALGRRIGTAPAVPDWVFGPWNDAVGGPERLAEVARLLRENDVPSSAIWSEDWIGGEQTGTGYRLSYAWEWDPMTYPTLADDIAALHRQGFAFLAYFNPFVPEPTRMFAEGTEGDWLIEDADGEVMTFRDPAFRNASMVDLTDDGARDWLRGYQVTAARDLGIDGWMADFAEWLPVDAVMRDGTSGWRFHNRYPLAWQQANVDAMVEAHAGEADPGDWTFFARSGWASVNGGTAGIAPALWAGDQNTDWARDDGFPTIIPIGVNVGLAGVAMFGHDIAGYTSETAPNTTKELFFRWASLGAMSPLMRTHHGSDECGNWAFDRDADTLAHYRRYAVVHTLLYPYLRARMDEASARGWPVMRHPAFSAPDSPGLWREARDQYFLGDDLIVAPVVEQGVVEREVAFPQGAGWWALFETAPLDDTDATGGAGETRVHTVPAPVTEIPIFVRPGTALPLLPEPVDSFRGAEDPDVTELDDLGGAVRVAIYPTADGAITPGLIGGASIEGSGWVGRPDWSTATVDGVPVGPCAEGADAPCFDPLGLRLPARATARVRVGEALLTIDGASSRPWALSWAGDAWGPWAEPTPVGDLDPDIPPPCED